MNTPSFLKNATIAIGLLSSACSAPEVQEKPVAKNCDTRTAEFSKALDDARAMLIAAEAYIDMARSGVRTATKDAEHLRPKIRAKLAEMQSQEASLRQFCPNAFTKPSNQLTSVPELSLKIAGVQKSIQALHGYLQNP